jgi:hypothetical protein
VAALSSAALLSNQRLDPTDEAFDLGRSPRIAPADPDAKDGGFRERVDWGIASPAGPARKRISVG